MTSPGHSLRAFALALLACFAPVGAAWAQAQAGAFDKDVEALRQAYDYANYAQVLERAQLRIDRGGLGRADLVELHKLAGLSAFNLGKAEVAERHLTALLQLDPDYNLDPFAVAPPAIAYFEELRKKLGPQLDLIRQQLRIEADRMRREADERARRQREEEERRRRVEELSRRITVRNVEKKNFLVNFVPFGAGQFQQDRTANGVVLAATQGAFALTSIIAFLAYEGMLEERTYTDHGGVGGPKQYTVRGIPKNRQAEANTWKIVKYASAGAFYTVYGYGVVDAIYHHEDEVVTTSTLQLPPDPSQLQPVRERPAEQTPAPDAPPPAPKKPEPEEKKDTVPLGPSITGQATDVSASPFLFPTPGGIGAGLHLQF